MLFNVAIKWILILSNFLLLNNLPSELFLLVHVFWRRQLRVRKLSVERNRIDLLSDCERIPVSLSLKCWKYAQKSVSADKVSSLTKHYDKIFPYILPKYINWHFSMKLSLFVWFDTLQNGECYNALFHWSENFGRGRKIRKDIHSKRNFSS